MYTPYLQYYKSLYVTLDKNRNAFFKDKETRPLKGFSSIFEEGDGLVFVRFVKPLKLKINNKI